MKRVLAFLCYYAGLMMAIGFFFAQARHADAWHFLILPIYVVPSWWIVAGVGIRLGVPPSEFFRSLARVVGFVEPEQQPERVTQDSP